MDDIYRTCDYITIHVPLLDSTRKMINQDAIDLMKENVVILNFARDMLVDEEAVVKALKEGKVKKYVCDFRIPQPQVWKMRSSSLIWVHPPQNRKTTVQRWQFRN